MLNGQRQQTAQADRAVCCAVGLRCDGRGEGRWTGRAGSVTQGFARLPKGGKTRGGSAVKIVSSMEAGEARNCEEAWQGGTWRSGWVQNFGANQWQAGPQLKLQEKWPAHTNSKVVAATQTNWQRQRTLKQSKQQCESLVSYSIWT